MIDRSLNYGRDVLSDILVSHLDGSIKNIVDIGAGNAEDLLIAKQHLPEANFDALEGYDPNLYKLTRKGFNAHSLNLENEKFPFDDGTRDLIIANQILEHCKEIFWIFHEISRTLRVGGYLYLGVPNLASLHSRLLLLLGRQPTCIRSASAHVRGFTKSDLVHFLESSFPGGYQLEVFRGSNFYPLPRSLAKLFAKGFPNSAVCIFFLLRKVSSYDRQFLDASAGLETNFFIG